jgi:hypothetical protein
VLGTSTPSIKSDVKFAESIKKLYPDTFVVLVGTHPSACPEETLGYSTAVGAVAIGEYDCIVKELADALEKGDDLSKVRGLCYRDKDKMVRTEPMPPLKSLDDLPYAAQFIKEHLDEKDYFFAAATYPSIQIFTGRGCPFRCNFCVYPQTMHGHAFRARSAENVVGEFEYIAKNFPDVKEVVIEDDTFTANKKRVKDICQMLIEKGLHKRLRWLCNARVDLDLDTMAVLENFIEDFNGAIIFVSHDRFFTDRMAQKVFVFDDDAHVQIFMGGYSDYKAKADAEQAEKIQLQRQTEKARASAGPATERVKPKSKSRGLSTNEAREYAEIEAVIASKESELKVVEMQMAMNGSDYDMLRELTGEQERLTAELDKLMDRWAYLEEKAQES